MMIEAWKNIQSRQTAVQDILSEKLSEIRPLLATSPSGSYYRLVDQK